MTRRQRICKSFSPLSNQSESFQVQASAQATSWQWFHLHRVRFDSELPRFGSSGTSQFKWNYVQLEPPRSAVQGWPRRAEALNRASRLAPRALGPRAAPRRLGPDQDLVSRLVQCISALRAYMQTGDGPSSLFRDGDRALCRQADPLRDPITHLQDLNYERLLLCLPRHCPLRAGSEVTKHLEFVCIQILSLFVSRVPTTIWLFWT